jgi:hypothetical protein
VQEAIRLGVFGIALIKDTVAQLTSIRSGLIAIVVISGHGANRAISLLQQAARAAILTVWMGTMTEYLANPSGEA